MELLEDFYLSDNVGDAAKEWNVWRTEVVDYAVREKVVPALLQVRGAKQMREAACDAVPGFVSACSRVHLWASYTVALWLPARAVYCGWRVRKTARR